jgi:hypothetical protein
LTALEIRVRIERIFARSRSCASTAEKNMRNKADLLLIFVLLAAAVPLVADEDLKRPPEVITSQRFNFPSGGVIKVQGSYGDVYIEGWDQEQVEVGQTGPIGKKTTLSAVSDQSVEGGHTEEGCRSISFHAGSSAVGHSCYAQMKMNAVPDITHERSSRSPPTSGCVILTSLKMATGWKLNFRSSNHVLSMATR